MIKVSVIMPVYNSETYLENCIHSVLKQEFDNFELLLIDDGSTDRSGDICDRFASTDERVIVFHKENGGLCSARNMGLQMARGEYVAFCDNDDEYLPGLLSDNYELAIKYSADVVRYCRRRVATFPDGKTTVTETNMDRFCDRNSEYVLHTQKCIERYDDLYQISALDTVWCGLYKKTLFDDSTIKFDTRMHYGGEDIMLNLKLIKKEGIWVLNNRVYYQYYKRYSESTSTKFSFNRAKAMLLYAQIERDLLAGNEKTRELWDRYRAAYVIRLTDLLNHRDCNWSMRKKRYIMNCFLMKSVLGTDVNGVRTRGTWRILLRTDIKGSVVMFLFEHKLYSILLRIMKGYHSLPGHQTFGM